MSFYTATPIYYVNSTPHIGHAYTTIVADILVAMQAAREETYFLTGVDEHADKVARVAAEEGLSPQEYVDRIVPDWRQLAPSVNAEPDYFIRTTDEGHKRFVEDFLQRIHDNGDIYQDVYAGLYCVGCEAFKTEEELVGGKCPDHGIEPEWLEEELVLPSLRLRGTDCSGSTTSARTSCCRPSGQRGAELHRGRAARLLDQPRHAGVGDRSPGIRIRSPTSGPMRWSTT